MNKKKYMAWSVPVNHSVKNALRILLDDAEARNYDPPIPGEAVAELEWVLANTNPPGEPTKLTQNGEISLDRRTGDYLVFDETYTSVVCRTPVPSIAEVAHKHYSELLRKEEADTVVDTGPEVWVVACSWRVDDGVWMTSCGKAHVFFDLGPAENNYIYCPYCGNTIKNAQSYLAKGDHRD